MASKHRHGDVCPYCGGGVDYVTGRQVYPHRPDLFKKKFFMCLCCEARVGVHHATGEPMGRLADGALRKAKMRAHLAFDPIWKSKGMPRTAAYKWLTNAMAIKPTDCHMGMFDENECDDVVRLCRAEFGTFGEMSNVSFTPLG